MEALTDPKTLAVAGVAIGISVYLLSKQTSKPMRRIKASQQTVLLPNPNSGESSIYRNASIGDGPLLDNYNGFRTLDKVLINGFTTHADKDFIGTRTTNSDGSRGEFVFKTYRQFFDLINNFASGLQQLELSPGDRVGIYSINCEEWIAAENACYFNNLVVVSLYDTLGPDAAQFIMKHAGTSTVIVSKEVFPKLVGLLNGTEHGVKTIIVLKKVDDVSSATNMGIKVFTFDEIVEKGKSNKFEPKSPQPEDLATIMYTSGTTGEPKGVMLTHNNVCAALGGFALQNDEIYDDQEVYLSYLPLAHIMERVGVYRIISLGGKIGIYSGVIPKLLEDFQALKPTFIAGAPRVYQRIYDRVIGAVNESGTFKRWLFYTAFEAKKKALQQGKTTPFWDKVVFSKLNEKIFGGRVRTIVSGSAPLSTQVHEFLQIVFTEDVAEGYGLTETTAATAIQKRGNIVCGTVGPPIGCLEVKLVDVPDRKYFTNEKLPRGEIYIRGPNVMKGYYKNEEKTKEAFTEDGWFMSGDIGRFNEDGTLSIIDRKKNIFKLSIGEYVAPEYLENVYCRSTFVAQCFVYGDSLKPSVVAIVVPDEEVLKKWAKSEGIQGDFSELCSNSQIKKKILDDMVATGKTGKLQGFEIVKEITLESQLWSIENGILTPTMKLKRVECQQKYQKQIDEMYKNVQV